MITATHLVKQALEKVVDVTVCTKVPRARPKVFVRIEQSAPVAYSPSHDRTVVIVQVYGSIANQKKVLDIIGACRDYLRFSVTKDIPEVVGWQEISGPVEFPDPDLDDTTVRWQFVGTLYQTLV